MSKADEWQAAMREVNPKGASAWESLKRAYNRIMGNPRVPPQFGNEQSLPPHLRDLVQESGGYEQAMRTKLGDLDRELLRATYDRDYYREPLMGYVSYEDFQRKYGENAIYEKIQKLSPAERLEYLVNFGRQQKSERDAATQLSRDLNELRRQDSTQHELDQYRDAVRQQNQVAMALFEETVEVLMGEMKVPSSEYDGDDLPSPTEPKSGQDSGNPSVPAQSDHDPSRKDPGSGHTSGNAPGNAPQHGASGDPMTSIDTTARNQIVWDVTRETSPGLFTRLTATYDRVMGNIKLPAMFNDPASLPQHLRDLVSASGGYEKALRGRLGDLDRELLRATFDRSYYKEPLMGYIPYSRFMAKHGENAAYEQIQKLSPHDRLLYLLNHGSQSAETASALQAVVRDYRRQQQDDMNMQALEQSRERFRQGLAVNRAAFENLVDLAIQSASRRLRSGDDDGL